MCCQLAELQCEHDNIANVNYETARLNRAGFNAEQVS